MPKHIETCCTCQKPFEANRSTQTHCAAPCLARTCINTGCNSGPRPEHASNFLKTSALTIVEQRKAQMEELFFGYDRSADITITKAKEGAKIVVLSDMQIPFEEQWLIGGTTGNVGAIEAFLKDYKPDYVLYDGDIFDCYTISSFAKSPNRRFTVRNEGEKTRRMLEAHRNAQDGKMIFIDGNHEYRLWRTLIEATRKDRGLAEILDAADFRTFSSKELLKLDELGIDWLPYGGYVDFLGFKVTHGDMVSSESAGTAAKMLNKWHSSGASGHTHRLGQYHLTGAAGDSHAWYELGCLCRLDPEYLNGPNWQQGFLVGEVSGGKLHPQLISVFDYRFVVNGVTYKAKGV